MIGHLTANPVFPAAARVALVQMHRDQRVFGVAMRGGKYVVPLPMGYDGRTNVRWINGYIVVVHPDPQLPPLLADTTTGKTSPLDAAQYTQMLTDIRRLLGVARNAKVIH